MPLTIIIDHFLVTGSFLGVLLMVLIISKKSKQLPDYILASIFLLNALTIILSYLEIYNREHGYPYPGLINTSTPLILLHGPALYLYVRSMTQQHFRIRPRDAWHAVPFFLLSGFFAFTVYTISPAEKIGMELSGSVSRDIGYLGVVLIILVSTQTYFATSLVTLKKYKKKISAYFSSLEDKDLKWLRLVVVLAMICYACISTLYLLDFLLDWMPYATLQATGFSIASAYLLTLAFFGLRHRSLFSSMEVQLDLNKTHTLVPNASTLDPEDASFVHKLLGFMQEKEPYLDPDLTLAGLSQQLGVSPDYLSSILNNQLNKNFFDFINHYRVEAFKALCRIPGMRKLTILSLAFESGFNSKATFNRVFKKATNTTPSGYWHSVSEK